MATQVSRKPESKKVDNPVAEPSIVNNQFTGATEWDNSVNVFNIMWDSWLDSTKLAQAYQRKMGDLALQAIAFHKDFLVETTGNLEEIENGIKEFMEDSKSYFLEGLNSLNLGSFANSVEEWSDRFEEVTNRLQSYGTPSKIFSNHLEKYLDQVETSLKAVIQKQEESQDNVQALLENFINQVKKTNTGLKKTWEANRSSLFCNFK
jgi:hypothetical protein